MGRESDAWLGYNGASGAGKILLESTEIILRGAVRARIPRSAITSRSRIHPASNVAER